MPRNNFSWNNESKKVTRQGMGNAGICVSRKKNILKIPEFPIGPFMPGQFKMATSCYSGVQSFYEFEFDLFSTFYIFFDYQYFGLL